jgi:uncharacterized membrane protein
MSTIDWTAVEEAEAEKTLTGYKVALLEAAKLLDERLQAERVPGRTFAERVQAARFHFTKPDELNRAAVYVEGLRSGVTGGLAKDRAKTYLQSFRQGVADMNDLSQARDSVGAQVRLYLGLLKGRQRWLLRGLIGLGGFIVVVLILADTAPGQFLVNGIVDLVHGFFGLLVALLIALGAVLLVVLGTAVYLDRHRSGRVRGEDEE